MTTENGLLKWKDADSISRQYDLTEHMDFASALTAMKQGFKVTRWNGVLCPKVIAIVCF